MGAKTLRMCRPSNDDQDEDVAPPQHDEAISEPPTCNAAADETVVEPVIEEEVPVQEPPAETGWLSYVTGGSDAPASAAEPAASTTEEVDVVHEETLTYAEGTGVWDDE